MSASSGRQQGFTLVEILIALTIFTIGVLAVATMQTSSIRYNSAAKLASDAVFQAERRMEALLHANYVTVADGSEPLPPHTVSWIVNDQVTHRTIAVTVTWRDSSGNKSYTLNSIRGRNL